MEFTTLDQIEAHFQPLIAAAGEDASRVMQLRLERADARDLVRDGQDRERALTDARAAALQEYPYARQEEMRGATPAEVAAAAKASHEHVTAILAQERQRQEQERQQGQDTLDQQGRQRYGRGSAGGGTGEPPAAGPSAFEQLVDEHQTVMDQVKSGMPFDFKENGLQGRAFAGVMNEIAARTVNKNLILIDRGKAASAEDARVQRGGVQFE